MRIKMFLRRHCITALFLLALPAIVQAQFTFTTNDNSLTIIGYTGPGGAVAIPGSTNGYTVTGVGDFAFAYSTSLTNINIPASVTNIGEAPFLGCSSLTNISVDAGNPVYVSANGALVDKDQYTLIQYPNGLTNETYVIPNGYSIPVVVTNIGPYAFASCTSLKNVTYSGVIGWYIYSIGDFAFSGCSGLTSVTITNTSTVPYIGDATATSIGADAFSYCTSLTNFFAITPVSDVGGLAFAFCTNLTAAYFPSNAPPDVGNAFYGDPEAIVYYMPGTTGWGPTFGGAPTVEETNEFEFYYETIDDSITITGYNGPGGAVVIPSQINGYAVTSIAANGPIGVFPRNVNVTSVTIPSTVTSIGFEAFENCNMSNIVIPNSVTTIGQSAFQSCTSLASITIPNSVTNIGGAAFQGCESLTNIAIPESVTIIGGNAFEFCENLTSITIPASVTNIGGILFYGCNSLADISVDAANPSYSSLNGVLFDKALDTVIAYPAALTNDAYIIPNSVTNIAGYAFSDCGRLASISIPNGVTSIGTSAFFGCSGLTNIVIPSSVTSIGEWAFGACESLRSAYFQDNAPPDAGSQIFIYAQYLDPVIVYYLPDTTGWGATFGGVPTELWNPQATAFATAAGQFAFNITGPTNATIVVEACTNLTNPVWLPVSTNTLSTNGTSSFNDPQWANYPNRYYRFRAP